MYLLPEARTLVWHIHPDFIIFFKIYHNFMFKDIFFLTKAPVPRPRLAFPSSLRLHIGTNRWLSWLNRQPIVNTSGSTLVERLLNSAIGTHREAVLITFDSQKLSRLLPDRSPIEQSWTNRERQSWPWDRCLRDSNPFMLVYESNQTSRWLERPCFLKKV